ncbi:hypothetical protein G7Y89_g8943 [Cudoniella acicularis]|uniref:Tc1-like transposase DDE domain-containing protein n=1 Tax=Cudoniella acicularis TaxID=354080 RepID=A0A8H4RI94_9HELO|nr:hypothetical protein G7Y89_g8943 [Cudoniella acicularis]
MAGKVQHMQGSSIASWDSRNGPRPANLTPHPPRMRRSDHSETTRDDRIRIQTALLFDIPHDLIRYKPDVTEGQIYYASRHRPTPQKALCHAGKVKLHTPQRQRLEQWLQASPSRKHVPWRYVPGHPALDLGVDFDFGEKAIKDGGDRLESSQHKYSKALSWMFHGPIIDGRKGPARFWESRIQNFFEEYEDDHYVFMQDNAQSHRSCETRINLRRHILTWIFPPWSPDLNLIEHVWNLMKNWMQEQYWEARYNPSNIPYERLRVIITKAWNAVPDSYIVALYDSWWRRCRAVIDARGGPTKY